MIDPSSKMSLKLSCLEACRGNIDEAEKLYNYVAKDLTNLPDFTQPRPNAFQQVTQAADQVFGWVDQNGDKLMKGYNLIQMIRNGAPLPGTSAPITELPPLPPLQ